MTGSSTSANRVPDGVRFEFVRATGPGGQNVNKVATAVQLRFDVRGSRALAPEVRDRLMRQEANRISGEGELIIVARRFRSQERNREDAVERLLRLIERAANPPAKRHKTRPSLAAKQRRLDEKRQRSAQKRVRGRAPSAEE